MENITQEPEVEEIIKGLQKLYPKIGFEFCQRHCWDIDKYVRETITTLTTKHRKEVEKVVREERGRIKKEIVKQTLLNDGTDTFVKLGDALWVCDSIEDRKAFLQALTPTPDKQ